jgi:hypothetical protein
MVNCHIPEPFVFNPLKHHLAFIKDFSFSEPDPEKATVLIKEIKHLGTSVMDVYTGKLKIEEIINEISKIIQNKDLLTVENFSSWTGKGFSDFKIVTLSDNSQWTLKYYQGGSRYVHFFPARLSPHTFRVKANTLKSAILYILLVGKDYVTGEDLNRTRGNAGLSPVKEVAETEAISEMIEIIRNDLAI